MAPSTAEDDEAFARKLQEKYEQEHRQRRAERQKKAVATTTAAAAAAAAPMTSSSHAGERSARRVATDRGVSQNKHPPSRPAATIDTTASDEALARALQDELGAEEKKHSGNRNPRPTTTVTGSSRQSRTTSNTPPPLPSAPDYEHATEDTTAADEAYAKKLQEEMNKRAERSRHARTLRSTAPVKASEKTARPSTVACSTHSSSNHEKHDTGTMPSSSHGREKNIKASATGAAPTSQPLSSTSAHAKERSSSHPRTSDSHERSSHPHGSTATDPTVSNPSTLLAGSNHGGEQGSHHRGKTNHAERSSHPRATTNHPERSFHPRASTDHPERSSHPRASMDHPERSSHPRASMDHPERSFHPLATSDQIEHSSSPRATADHPEQSSNTRVGASTKAIDPPASTAILSANSASPTSTKVPDGTENDESLARRLEQEMKDEELARRLSEEETRKRRRTSYLARKKNHQRNKPGDHEAGNKPMDEAAMTRPVPDDGLPSLSRGRSKSPYLAGIKTSGTKKSRRDNGPKNRSRSPVPGKSQQKRDAASPLRSTAPVGSMAAHKARPEQARTYTSGVSVSGSDDDDVSDPDLDAELAQKMEQEERDAALARQMNIAEVRQVSVYHLNVDANGRRQSAWTFRRAMSLAIPVVIILAALVGLAFAFSGGNGLPSLPGGAPPVFENGDPFQGVTPEKANRWNSRGSGLSLEILNALDDSWNANFVVAIDEWDSGTPDALTLRTTRVPVDSSCAEVTGKLKVCNGDYGDTKWRGINQVKLSNNYIVSSVAKLNEFYLASSDENQRQYTMCHEIGHGFGLPHTDENFYNADLGNCMDYTSNPEVNKQPAQVNYLFLFDLYGLATRRHLEVSNVVEMSIPDSVNEMMDALVPELDCDPIDLNEYAEEYLCDLGNGFSMLFSMLLAVPNR